MVEFAQYLQDNPIALLLFVFVARIVDVSLGTLRIILLARGQKTLAPILGFFELFIWIVAISQLLTSLTSFWGFLAYAAGFATGNYIGMLLEEKLALGMVALRIFAIQDGPKLLNLLRKEGFGVTSLEGRGAETDVQVLFIITHRRDLKRAVKLVHDVNPKTFYSIEEVRGSNEGVFPQSMKGIQRYRRFFQGAKRK